MDPFTTVSAKELDKYVENKDIIIDLREKKAYRESHIENAINIPFETIDYRYFEQYRYRVIILYCDRGSTSMIVAKELSKRNYKVKTVIGGIRAYRGKHLQKY